MAKVEHCATARSLLPIVIAPVLLALASCGEAMGATAIIGGLHRGGWCAYV